MPIFASGAFFQQCFSVHPLSLNLKLVRPPETLGIYCENCRMRHRMTIAHSTAVRTEPSDPDSSLTDFDALYGCFQSHPDDVRIAKVDVEHDGIQFRCRPCHRIFALDVCLFETYQS
ncbi:MAG: hypothetical protein KC563_06060 [Nitrospira sp.]|nr:hypothetical protein [Nitrospira sp.]MCA9475356.1 hypothetical protein [Nitrospira sp.]MCB9711796.1 hypothetical protein [Nitrospiraceae bacterium]MDR4488789.1 hypothetical protein [Nitrospirales bacterium]